MTTARECSYRPDVDGLRAVAVLLVVFQHYLVPGFRGGFVGVDIFFVISGYLIAGHIHREIGAGAFSLLGFYERRIRRIVPALFVMYALVLVAAEAILFPPDLHFLSSDAIYVIPFLANVAFYRNAGVYGGEFADRIALLHTWSLAIEEQFYLLFPLLMLAIARFGRRQYIAILAPLAAASLGIYVAASHVLPLAAFYLAPFRAWELLLGAILAVGHYPQCLRARSRAAIALLGLLLIGASDWLLSHDLTYSGELTILACLGAVLVLYARCDPNTVAGRILVNPVMTRIGLWSYSIYLFHWPLLVLSQYLAFDPLSTGARAVLLTATILLAALSWRFVEQPFRGHRAFFNRQAIYAVAGLSGAALTLAALMIRNGSDPLRYDQHERALFPPSTADQIKCRTSSPEIPPPPPCELGRHKGTVDAVVWGDSHALAMLPAVKAAYTRHGETAMLALRLGCPPPLLGVRARSAVPGQSNLLLSYIERAGFSPTPACTRHTEAVLHWVIAQRIPTVILAGHWIAYTEANNQQRLTDAESPHNYDQSANAAVFERGLERLLTVLNSHHVRVFVLDDVPLNSVNVPYALASAQRLGERRDFRISDADYSVQQQSAEQIFKRLHKRYHFGILKPQEVLCATGKCSISGDGNSYYRDEQHLSLAGAMAVEPALEEIWSSRTKAHEPARHAVAREGHAGYPARGGL